MKFHYGDPRPVVLRGLYNDNNELLSTKVLPDHQVIQIITRIKQHRGSNNELMVKQFDESGKIHKEIHIESSKGYNLMDAIAHTDTYGNTPKLEA